jgi:SIR2-like protein
MTFILLTGAGFSYNWGGPLASDVFSALLADTSLDTHTRDLLFDSGGAFEKVLADLHVSADPDDQKRHDALITAVAGIFNGMNNTFMHVPFEFENPPSVQHSMAAFLSRFHAIFTLNQDALLEQHYNPHIGPPMNWGDLQLPGMRFMPPFRPTGARQDKFAIMEPNPPFGNFPSVGAQPYVKLHGSVNWIESNRGKRILIMGGQKAVSIGLYPILTWYHDEFRKMLTRPSAKLMVIGYSFSDSHINDAIVDGIAAGLKLFVVDPYALKALQNDPRIGSARSALIGYSNRSLKDTFGGDRCSHNQVSQFFT